MKSGRTFYNFKQAEDRLIARLTRAQETEAMLAEQDGYWYPNWQSDVLYDREVEQHQTGEGRWTF